MNCWWLWLFGFFLSSFVLTGICRLYALRINMLDIPNTRSSHTVPTPRGGGIGLVFVFLIGSYMVMKYSTLPATIIAGVVCSGLLIAIVGFIDDHYHLSSPLRLTVHIIASLLFIYIADTESALYWLSLDPAIRWLAYLVAVTALVWLLNLYNFMDGIDGIAGIEGISVGSNALLILWTTNDFNIYSIWLTILVVAIAGFLPWNWSPAKIFMGDVGSSFIGFILGCFIILTAGQPGINIWAWFILLGVFIVDATITLLTRILRRKRFWKAHRSHAYQILARRYKSHTKITLATLLINTLWLFPCALLSTRYSSHAFLIAITATLPLVILAIVAGAGRTNDKIHKLHQ